MHREKNELAGKVESTTIKKDKFAKVVADLETWLKESESWLEEFELRASREREANKELEEELLMYKEKVVEQHEKGFHKVIRPVGFFTKHLDLGLFDLSRNDGICGDEPLEMCN